ncbi:MAG: hypothetical protein A2Y17_07910 [Clostridiales bacterium GWF2_38_85]|nr:MAG: hypothetical protein A2Y17_07910 [Clostridiales bacterium GWF2_38_85]HBL84199.1 hypothetical protein [Clostridiales bacterium]
MKKIAAFLAIMMIATTLFACKNPKSTESENTSSETVSNANPQITLPFENLTLGVGQTYTLEPEILNADDTEITYESSRESVAEVSEDGVITAITVGDSVISVTVGTVTAEIKLTVKRGATDVVLTFDKCTLGVGDTVLLEVSLLPDDLFNSDVFYRSLNEDIATVDEDGNITAVAKGEAVIEAYTINEKSAQCTVTVLPHAESITLDKIEIELKVDANATLTAVINPEDSIDTIVTFTSEDKAIAIVDANGVITGKAVGTTKITAAAGSIKTECTVTVTETPKVVEVTSVTLDKGNTTIYVGNTLTLKATVSPNNADDKRVTFSSSNKAVATVSTTGVVTAVAKGITVITAAGVNSRKASITITVDDSESKAPQLFAPHTYKDAFDGQTKSFVGHVFTDPNYFVIFGTCDGDATITAKTTKGQVITTKADHGIFNITVKKEDTKTKVTLTAKNEGMAESDPVTYEAAYVDPMYIQSSNYWRIIGGSDSSFFLYDHNGYLDFMRTNTYSQSQLDQAKSNINKKVAAIKQYNPDAELIYMVVPAAATIYPERMPSYFEPLDKKSRIEQIYGVIEDSDAVLIDLISLFNEHKNDDLKMYWKTDTHWTDYGAFLAYTELFDYIKQRFPEAAPREFDEFDFVEDYYYSGDMSVYLGYSESTIKEYNARRVPKFSMSTQLQEISEKRYVSAKKLTYTPSFAQNQHIINTGNNDLPNCIVMRDSYGTQIMDIIPERMNQTVMRGMWDYGIRTQELNTYKPDYVIIVIVERNIDSIIN